MILERNNGPSVPSKAFQFPGSFSSLFQACIQKLKAASILSRQTTRLMWQASPPASSSTPAPKTSPTQLIGSLGLQAAHWWTPGWMATSQTPPTTSGLSGSSMSTLGRLRDRLGKRWMWWSFTSMSDKESSSRKFTNLSQSNLDLSTEEEVETSKRWTAISLLPSKLYQNQKRTMQRWNSHRHCRLFFLVWNLDMIAKPRRVQKCASRVIFVWTFLCPISYYGNRTLVTWWFIGYISLLKCLFRSSCSQE